MSRCEKGHFYIADECTICNDPPDSGATSKMRQKGRCDDCDGPECESCGGVPDVSGSLLGGGLLPCPLILQGSYTLSDPMIEKVSTVDELLLKLEILLDYSITTEVIITRARNETG